MLQQTTPGMTFGAVAMFDVLGFRGIWTEERSKGKWKPEEVIRKMELVKEYAKKERDLHLKEFPVDESQSELGLQVLFLSDTVVVFTTVKPKDHKPYIDDPRFNDEQNGELRAISDAGWILRSFAALRLCVMIAARAIGAGAIDPPEFNFRGAITVGDFLLGDGTFFLGPAIDNCADAYERAQGAFVLLTNAAREFVEEAHRARSLLESAAQKRGEPLETDLTEIIQIPELLKYTVKCKKDDGSEVDFETLVVNPLSNWTRDSWEDRAASLLSFFDTQTASVVEKKVNTRAFLRHVIDTHPNGIG